jgi:hypothetical protein
LRVGKALYALHAVSVTDESERAAVAAAYASKYELDANDNWVDDALVYRLDRPE